MQDHNGTIIKTREDFFKKIYLSLYLQRFVCERELEAEQNCNILTPTLMAISVVSRSPWLLNRRPRDPALCWMMVFSTASCHQRVSKLNRESQRPLLPGGGFVYHILSLTHLISNSLTSCLHRVIK